MVDHDDVPRIPEARSLSYFFRGQLIHLGSIPFLAAIAYAFASPSLGDQTWLGLSDAHWFGLALLLPIVHQVYVWVGWRAQLGFQTFTRIFGRADFKVWGAIFMPLLVSRPLVILGLAIADAGSADLPAWWGWALGGALLPPALYALYSVQRYFGLDRALGGDHFRTRYRHMPFVREGAFKWTSNAMYTVAFLAFWGIALVAGSRAALAAAFFHHAYIWAHYLGTEEPDMQLIYGQPDA